MRIQSQKSFATIALVVIAIASALFTGKLATARTTDDPVDTGTTSALGNYLAGRFAKASNDTARAVTFYRRALAREPENERIVEQAFQVEAVEGNYVNARELALKILTKQPSNRLANVWLGVSEFQRGDFAKSRTHFKNSAKGPIGELTSVLALSWLDLALGDSAAALRRLDKPAEVEWARFYIAYHRALIAELAGKGDLALENYATIFRIDSRTPRFALAYATSAARLGKVDQARSILKQHIERAGSTTHPMVVELVDKLDGKTRLESLVSSPAKGMSEVFYGLGEALAGEGGLSIGASYIRLALHIEPEAPFALATLANIHESMKHHERAIGIYDLMPKGTALDTAVQIRKAINLSLLDRVDEAKSLLDELATRDPTDIRPLDALGNLMRSRKRYKEATEYYSKIIATISEPEKQHWTYWYSRGTSYERLKQWPNAERDLKKAMELSPDQPLILNYLGYSWIDQNMNLRQGMRLIEKAVALKPDDGYIVDSLGWAHYKLGNFPQAVRYLERAVELRPEDPVLNDHLGDALWRVGREREAIYQWEQALTLKPEPEDEVKIKAKLASGLPPIAKPAVKKKPRRTARNKQAGSNSDIALPFQ
ncbi:MAG: hypothetical protein RLZ98_3015 [Pseudomonadota bacterium]|jgi:tetratricopeptide (TPR) repeat protein